MTSLRLLKKRMWRAESGMLQTFEDLEKHCGIIDNLRDLLSKRLVKLEKREQALRAGLGTKARAEYVRVRAEKQKHERTIQSAELKLRREWDRNKGYILKYHAQKDELHIAELVRECDRRTAEEAVQESGPGLLETLGTALFAWKASNAFDDLSAIRKSLKK